MNENSIKSLFKRSGNGKVVTMGYFSESQALDFYTLNLSDEIPIEKMGMTWISGIDSVNYMAIGITCDCLRKEFVLKHLAECILSARELPEDLSRFISDAVMYSGKYTGPAWIVGDGEYIRVEESKYTKGIAELDDDGEVIMKDVYVHEIQPGTMSLRNDVNKMNSPKLAFSEVQAKILLLHDMDSSNEANNPIVSIEDLEEHQPLAELTGKIDRIVRSKLGMYFSVEDYLHTFADILDDVRINQTLLNGMLEKKIKESDALPLFCLEGVSINEIDNLVSMVMDKEIDLEMFRYSTQQMRCIRSSVGKYPENADATRSLRNNKRFYEDLMIDFPEESDYIHLALAQKSTSFCGNRREQHEPFKWGWEFETLVGIRCELVNKSDTGSGNGESLMEGLSPISEEPIPGEPEGLSPISEEPIPGEPVPEEPVPGESVPGESVPDEGESNAGQDSGQHSNQHSEKDTGLDKT